jgi:hypothetical protein
MRGPNRRADNTRWIPRDNYSVRDVHADDGSCSDRDARTHISHDNAACANPCVWADSDAPVNPALIRQPSGCVASVLPGAAEDLYTRSQQHAVPEVHLTKHAVSPDMDAFPDSGIRVREIRTELDVKVAPARLENERVISSADISSRQPRAQGEHLAPKKVERTKGPKPSRCSGRQTDHER